MADKRRKDANWNLSTDDGSYWGTPFYGYAQLAVLMDLRDELKKLNRVFECPNFLAIPATLREINRNTTKKKRAKK